MFLEDDVHSKHEEGDGGTEPSQEDNMEAKLDVRLS